MNYTMRNSQRAQLCTVAFDYLIIWATLVETKLCTCY
jgi:hypothetical protein